jgi:hypothetical protein
MGQYNMITYPLPSVSPSHISCGLSLPGHWSAPPSSLTDRCDPPLLDHRPSFYDRCGSSLFESHHSSLLGRWQPLSPLPHLLLFWLVPLPPWPQLLFWLVQPLPPQPTPPPHGRKLTDTHVLHGRHTGHSVSSVATSRARMGSQWAPRCGPSLLRSLVAMCRLHPPAAVFVFLMSPIWCQNSVSV